MRLVILAAGKGERLWPLTKTLPKSLLPMGSGQTLLGMQLAHAHACGIDDVVVVIGYRGAQIEEHIQQLGGTARTVFNPFFDLANNLVSAWVARHELEDDFILLNGDVVFHPEVLRRLMTAPPAFVRLVIDRKDSYDEDDMKVTLEGESIRAVSKTIPPDLTHAESIGMIRFSPAGAQSLVETLERMVRDPQNRDVFYLAAIQELVRAGPVAFCECSPDEWAEVDFHPDLSFVHQNIRRFDQRIAKWGK